VVLRSSAVLESQTAERSQRALKARRPVRNALWSSPSKTEEIIASRHACLLALLAVTAVAVVPQATAREHRTHRRVAADRVQIARVLSRIRAHRDETWRWQHVINPRLKPYPGAITRGRSLAYHRWMLQLWRRRAALAKRRALNPPHRRQWLCIHRYEAPWRDPRPPYYGGLQMDREFQVMYGAALLERKGTADRWTPLEQMWVAERAFRTRGFWPWPNTAKYCGLL
jgi:hypothetical protein